MDKSKRLPFIAVSREAGSGGKLIAKMVAQKLGFKFYDEGLIDLVAKTAHKRKRVIVALDEREREFIDDLVHRLLNPEYVSAQTYIKSLVQVIQALALKGGIVILGRGANFVVERHAGLNVRVIAPYLVRVGYTMKYEKRSKEDAQYRIKKYDRERKEFVRQFFGKDPSNTNYYDVVINTEQTSIEQAVEMILEAYRQKFKGVRLV
ncbi:hypothetical protein A2160_01165 [Candidatus Beckwithbacteria bacterium RBG_13_42_9]|uniref:Cytidylate kinase n=1 Tax=Candidatus Beckwithbacteria bacterium RBG_13_42_9 TaxID=1797457 RepID=A0A1F5E3I9_9BACT|nr:MAG: hypothetical protein A2160_01165 [Candidatus Beckwithbacteria bacterium RBG_13_42_9]